MFIMRSKHVVNCPRCGRSADGLRLVTTKFMLPCVRCDPCKLLTVPWDDSPPDWFDPDVATRPLRGEHPGFTLQWLDRGEFREKCVWGPAPPQPIEPPEDTEEPGPEAIPMVLLPDGTYRPCLEGEEANSWIMPRFDFEDPGRRPE